MTFQYSNLLPTNKFDIRTFIKENEEKYLSNEGSSIQIKPLSPLLEKDNLVTEKNNDNIFLPKTMKLFGLPRDATMWRRCKIFSDWSTFLIPAFF